jgi:hypothetical protein
MSDRRSGLECVKPGGIATLTSRSVASAFPVTLLPANLTAAAASRPASAHGHDRISRSEEGT